MKLIEKLEITFKTFKKNIGVVILLCLTSSLISSLCIPLCIKETFTPEIINSQINNYFAGGIDADQIILGLTWMFQLSTISGFLLIIAYIFKYNFDKRIFDIKKWQDWKFFLYASIVPLILIDLTKKFELLNNLNIFNNFFANLFTVLTCSLITIFLTSLILRKEASPIIINAEKIEKELTENNK